MIAQSQEPQQRDDPPAMVFARRLVAAKLLSGRSQSAGQSRPRRLEALAGDGLRGGGRRGLLDPLVGTLVASLYAAHAVVRWDRHTGVCRIRGSAHGRVPDTVGKLVAMNRCLPYALLLVACWAVLAGPSPAEGPTYIDNQKLSADFSAKLIDLAKEGKCLKADQLQQKLTNGKFKVVWKQPGRQALTPKQIYQQALRSVFVVGSVEESADHPGQWRDGRLASAWALTEDGVLVTNWHVFDKLGKECYGVVNSRGNVFPLVDALGADPAADIALIRVAGKGFTPLPLAADEEVGRALPCSATRATSSTPLPKGTSPATRRAAPPAIASGGCRFRPISLMVPAAPRC